jgi:protein-disulfide isomerase
MGALVAAACAKDGSATESAGKSTSSADQGIPAVLATIGDQKITIEDIRAQVGDDLDRLETQYQQSKSELIGSTLSQILRQRILDDEAKKNGKTYQDLVNAEAGINGVEPTQEEVAKWYNANASRVAGRPLSELESQIADLLRKEKRAAAEASLQARLSKQHRVVINYQPYRLAFDNANAPTLGKPGAPVTLIEFSDFQCPFCNRFAPTLKLVNEKYGDKVHIVYRQYPIPSLHPFAMKAAEASLCANEQGKFWQLHDLMFNDQSKLAVKDLKSSAAALGLDKKKFDTCLDSGRYAEQVQKDMAEGTRVGVTGTPAVFINGVELKGGAVPFETVAAAIDKELAQSAVSK